MIAKLFIIMTSLITGSCDNTVADYQPPMECMPVQVTNYIPYNVDHNGEPILVDGSLQFPTETNFQCMAPCNLTGSLLEITTESIGWYSACITDWFWHRIEVDGMQLWCVDSFGDTLYRSPYFDDDWQQWVIPVDVLTHEPMIYLTHYYN